jgi:hypothetical protein
VSTLEPPGDVRSGQYDPVEDCLQRCRDFELRLEISIACAISKNRATSIAHWGCSPGCTFGVLNLAAFLALPFKRGAFGRGAFGSRVSVYPHCCEVHESQPARSSVSFLYSWYVEYTTFLVRGSSMGGALMIVNGIQRRSKENEVLLSHRAEGGGVA